MPLGFGRPSGSFFAFLRRKVFTQVFTGSGWVGKRGLLCVNEAASARVDTWSRTSVGDLRISADPARPFCSLAPFMPLGFGRPSGSFFAFLRRKVFTQVFTGSG